MMDMRLWWLQCHVSQKQFCYYSTKHHPYIYYKAHRSTDAGKWIVKRVLPQWASPFFFVFQILFLFIFKNWGDDVTEGENKL